MFKDLLTFCPNIEILRSELIEKGFVDNEGNPEFPLPDRTPTQKREFPYTSSLVRCETAKDIKLMHSFDHLEILGTKEEVDADQEKTAKYEMTYSREPYTDEDPETGEEYTNTPPRWHGAFA